MPIGVTMMSAGSRTEPGGYTGQGKQSLHLTVKGRVPKRPPAARRQTANSKSKMADLRMKSPRHFVRTVWSPSGKIGIQQFFPHEA